MSNFADMAYDNYLMHYRTKGSRNGYTKDPDYTPVGEKARKMQIDKYSNQARRGDYAGMPTSVGEAQEKARSDKINKLIRENKQRRYDIKQLSEQKFIRGDYAGMPSSVVEITKQDIQKRRDESGKRWEDRMRLISKFSKQKSRGDYAGMPSSAMAAKERAERGSEIKRLSNRASSGDYSGMPTSAREAKERNAEIKKLHGQANRGDYAGMPSSARAAKENANRVSEISRLRTQRLRGDYAGMPSSALKAKENAQAARIEEAKGRYNRLNMQREAEARRKREYDPKMLAENEERKKLLNELRSKQKRPETNKFRAKEMQAEAEAKRLNSSYEKSKREKAASENRDRELLLAENRRRQRVAEKEKKRAEELERDKANKAERDNRVKDWEDIVSLNKSNSALRSTSGYGTPRGWLEERRKLLTSKGFIRKTSRGKGRKV